MTDPVRDTQRIDLLEKTRRVAEIMIDGKKVDCWHYGLAAAPGVSLREAIDAFAKAHEETP